jgi:hypothetical protein
MLRITMGANDSWLSVNPGFVIRHDGTPRLGAAPARRRNLLKDSIALNGW